MTWTRMDAAMEAYDLRHGTLEIENNRHRPGLVPCFECDGSGITEDRACSHSGACPCGGQERPCDRCYGSGVERCEECGEDAEVESESGRSALCRGCYGGAQ